MLRYGKQARQAVSAISYLAQHHGKDDAPLSSKQVAKARRMSAVLAAKLMSEMARAGLLVGSPGPGGGYRLARQPRQITLEEVVRVFEKEEDSYPCPFGPGWCGEGNPCPLHDEFGKIQRHIDRFLRNTTLKGFALRDPADGTLPIPG